MIRPEVQARLLEIHAGWEAAGAPALPLHTLAYLGRQHGSGYVTRTALAFAASAEHAVLLVQLALMDKSQDPRTWESVQHRGELMSPNHPASALVQEP